MVVQFLKNSVEFSEKSTEFFKKSTEFSKKSTEFLKKSTELLKNSTEFSENSTELLKKSTESFGAFFPLKPAVSYIGIALQPFLTKSRGEPKLDFGGGEGGNCLILDY